MAEQVKEAGSLTVYVEGMPPEVEVRQRFEAIQQFRDLVQSLLRQGDDFDTIPGTTKPTLLKPGAEKVKEALGLVESYDFLEKHQDWQTGLCHILVRCTLHHMGTGRKWSEGVGEANTFEARHRYRNANRKCPSCGAEAITSKKDFGRGKFVPGWLCWAKKGGCGASFNIQAPEIINQPLGRTLNDDLFSLHNTIVKMACKRAFVAAVLSAGRLSADFTQDMEDISPEAELAPPSQAQPSGPAAVAESPRRPAGIKTLSEFNRHCFGKYGLQPKESAEMAGFSDPRDIVDFDAAYQAVKEAMLK